MIDLLYKITRKSKRLAVGLMSGTSLDGVDAALVEIRGCGVDTEVSLIDFITDPYDSDEKAQILELCSPAHSSVDKLCKMNVYLGKKMAHAALKVIRKSGYDKNAIDFISSHGQTVYHMPQNHATLQIGELAEIAALTGCVTIGDYRPCDMAVGGQGAPLVPLADYLLFTDPLKGRALINIGGISNVTILNPSTKPQDVIAFDTGPGNILIDAVVRLGTGGKMDYDKNGNLAANGEICSQWLMEILNSDSFLHLEPPKSTGREYYSTEMAKRLMREGGSRGLVLNDIVATLTAYTVSAIQMHFANYIDQKFDIHEVYIGGGGVYNNTLMKGIKDGLKQKVCAMEALGCSSEAKEAVAFALLGNEFLFGNYNNLPSATGANRLAVMGKFVYP